MCDSQSYQQLQQVLKHWRTKKDPGSVLRMSIAWWQFVAGISQPMLQCPELELPHFDCESKYIESTRNFLASIGAYLELDDPGVPPLQREHDVFIMEEIMKTGRFTTTEIKRVNLCRLCLQVLTLADITRTNGTELDQSIYNGQQSMLSPKSRWLNAIRNLRSVLTCGQLGRRHATSSLRKGSL